MCKKIMEVRENLHCYFILTVSVTHEILLILHNEED